MVLGGERAAVQNPILAYAQQVGWQYLSPEDAQRLRGGREGRILKDVFFQQVQRLNPAFMDQVLAEELIKQIERIMPNLKGNLAMLEYLQGKRTVFVPDERRERNACLIDFDDVSRNEFHVTDEFSFTSGEDTIRADVVFLVNGVPVVIVETKAAHKRDGIAHAFDQIRRYHRQGPELLAILQVFALTHIIKFYYGPTWNTTGKAMLNWKDEGAGQDFEQLVKAFFDQERTLRLINDYILFANEDDELKKIVLRPHQMRAIERCVSRSLEPEKTRGLVWHTQGSGKTYTMIVIAKKIISNPLFENPTVLMLVDRNELESQLDINLRSVGFENLEVAGSKENLKQLLREDRRGLIVSMIHKFDDIPQDINTRRNVFILVDEAHRTTGGKLGSFLMAALPNATLIGFTGTPIDMTNKGKGTFVTFGMDDPKLGYLDKYSIAESIEDKTTVPLHYVLTPNELQVDRETLEREFLDRAEAEGITDVEALNKVLEKAVTLRNEMKNRDRVDKVARYVADHYTENVRPRGYKAFLVAVDREACCLYKEALDKLLPPEMSTVVISKGPDDEDHVRKHLIDKKKEKRIRKAFRNPKEQPEILIVTEKLLTGFDAPVLYCMYLDKPMRDHVLLQAIARVNRPYEDEFGERKTTGLIIDFVGIFDKLEKALAFDKSDIEGVVQDIELLKKDFADRMKKARETYLTLYKGATKDKAVEALLTHFIAEERRQEFYTCFKELSDQYEIISPDAFLAPYIKNYEQIASMYRILKENFEPHTLIDREFTKKTAKLVQEHTRSGDLGGTQDTYQIDGDTIRKIEESQASDIEKVFNLIRSIVRNVTDNRETEPFLLSIGERAEMIAVMFQDRQKTTQEALEELKGIIAEMNSARQEAENKAFSPEVFTVYWIMREESVPDPEDKAAEISSVLTQYPHWRTSEKHERQLRRALYGVLVKGKVKNMKDIVEKVLRILKGNSNGR